MLPGACRFNPTVAPCVALVPFPGEMSIRTPAALLEIFEGFVRLFQRSSKWTVPAVPPNAPWNEVDRGVEIVRDKERGSQTSPARLTPPRNAGRGTVLRGSLFRGWDHTGGHHGWNGPSLQRLSGIKTGIWTEEDAQNQSMDGIQL